MTPKKLPAIVVVILLIFCFSSFRNATADEKNIPFRPGEKLVYEIKWEFITAAEAILEVASPKTVDGVQSLHST